MHGNLGPERQSVDIENLTTEVKNFIPTLKEGIYILRGQGFNPEWDKDLLSQRYCGMAVRILGYLLRYKGYPFQEYQRDNIWGIGGRDHAILLTNPLTSTSILVDPTYRQFLPEKPTEKLPQSEVLITPIEDIDSLCKGLGQLNYSPSPYSSLEAHVRWYREIWNIPLYEKAGRPLEEDIEKYKHGGYDLTTITRELIRFMGKKGLI